MDKEEIDWFTRKPIASKTTALDTYSQERIKVILHVLTVKVCSIPQFKEYLNKPPCRVHQTIIPSWSY
jgi:hypothetical protein